MASPGACRAGARTRVAVARVGTAIAGPAAPDTCSDAVAPDDDLSADRGGGLSDSAATDGVHDSRNRAVKTVHHPVLDASRTHTWNALYRCLSGGGALRPMLAGTPEAPSSFLRAPSGGARDIAVSATGPPAAAMAGEPPSPQAILQSKDLRAARTAVHSVTAYRPHSRDPGHLGPDCRRGSPKELTTAGGFHSGLRDELCLDADSCRNMGPNVKPAPGTLRDQHVPTKNDGELKGCTCG